MKKLSIIALTVTLLLTTASAKHFGKKDVMNFCSEKTLPTSGIQFNGESANSDVMNLVAGKYSYPNGGVLLLFLNNYYLIKIPSNNNGVKGTSTDDLMGSGGILGGCSKEQLSEAISANGLSAGSFKLLKRYR